MQPYINQVLTYSNRAVATTGQTGVNVVPVSVVTTDAGDIILYDFFMDKTVKNILTSAEVALSAWEGFAGVQVKGIARYETTGNFFVTATRAMKERFPDRILRGIIRIIPHTVYDISAGPTAGTQLT